MSVGKYVGFVVLVVGAFGVSFEFPLVLVSLMAVGALSTTTLRKYRRYRDRRDRHLRRRDHPQPGLVHHDGHDGPLASLLRTCDPGRPVPAETVRSSRDPPPVIPKPIRGKARRDGHQGKGQDSQPEGGLACSSTPDRHAQEADPHAGDHLDRAGVCPPGLDRVRRCGPGGEHKQASELQGAGGGRPDGARPSGSGTSCRPIRAPRRARARSTSSRRLRRRSISSTRARSRQEGDEQAQAVIDQADQGRGGHPEDRAGAP